MNAESHLSADHPVALELKSLRTAVATFQHEAHEASVKLQKYSLDSSRSVERTRELESENSRLQEEIAVLRANPDIGPHPDSLRVQELDLAQRRLLDQLSITEATLELRTSELTIAQSELLKARQDAERAFDLASRIRAREEECKVRERELERKARSAEEERRMADLVVSEYADLVRSLEGRRSLLPPRVPPKLEENGVLDDQSAMQSTAPAIMDCFTEGKKGLKRLLGEFTVESERLEEKIAKLERELAVLETKLEADRKTAELDRTLLERVQAELVKLRIDDKAAARMVSRYMQFSQQSTLALQHAMGNLKMRHAATISTLTLEMDHLQISLASDRRHTKRLKAALDDLSEDISRETYGRRREVSLRLALLLREATVAEGIQRWSRKARELFYQSDKGNGDMQASFEKCVEGAEALLRTLNGDNSLEPDAHGAVARILAAQDSVSMLVQELHVETEKRMELERQRSHGLFSVPPAPALTATSGSCVNGEDNGNPSASVEPIALAEAATLASGLVKPNGVPPPVDGVSSASAVSASTASPTQPSSTAVVNSIPTVVVAHTEASHAPSLSLLDENFANEDPAPESERELDLSFTRDPVEPASKSIRVSDVSPSIVHQPAPRSLQEANFIHDGLSPETQSSSNSSLPSASPYPLLALNKGTELNVLTHNEGLSTSVDASSTSTIHPLTSDLDQVGHRYADLQRAFRNCHLALKDLKNTISSISPVNETVAVLHAAIQRLDDFNEDARVELEIRITDEELTTRGYQTLLNVPGAISNDYDQVEVEKRIRDFVDGTEKTVAKTTEQLHRKLDDLHHDVALIKKFLHELPDLELQRPSTPQTPTSWSSWTNILSSPRAASPAPPTFGTVMTSPRLRHSSSFTQPHLPGIESSSAELSPAPRTRPDPFASLGLRIPMPSHTTPTSCLGAASSSRSNPRPRALSGMYMLGLGSRSTSLAVNSPQSVKFSRSKSPTLIHWPDLAKGEAETDGETETEAEDEMQTDVE